MEGRRGDGRTARVAVILIAVLLVLAGTATAAAFSAHAGPLAVTPPIVEVAAAASAERAASTAVTSNPAASPALTVALFPWVPRPRQVEQAIAVAWSERHPDVPLRVVEWDCYASDPPEGADVFVFDSIYLRDYVERGLVLPLAGGEVDDAADLLPYALRAATADGGSLYGIPMYGCATLLFYRDGDAALEHAGDLDDLMKALGPARYGTVKPPLGRGLLLDMSDPSMDAFLYVEALEDTYGVYSENPPLAPTAAKLDPWAVHNLRDLRIMAGAKHAGAATTGQFTRAEWFGAGRGRALIGFSESLCAMSASARDHVRLKILPFAESGRGDVRLFYTDVAALDPSLTAGPRRDLALELANLLTSTEVLAAAIGPDADDPTPQYLFSVRRSVYERLAPEYPLYAQMYELIGAAEGSTTEPRPFRLGAGMDEWLAKMAPVIKRQVFAGR